MSFFVSQYLNIFPSHRKTSILFNGINASIDEVSQECGRMLKSLQMKKQPVSGVLPHNVLEFLAKRGHLTKKDADDEWQLFKKYADKVHAANQREKELKGSFLIIPSYHCNLTCDYCFQKEIRYSGCGKINDVMSTQTVDTIFTKVLSQLYPKVDRLSKIHVTLYGGEPFLERNRPALERIFSYTQKYQMPVSTVTNGSSLGTYLDYFGVKKGLVSHAQISFDGDKECHDKSRITKEGRGSFERIIANIHKLIDAGVLLNLRVNLSKANVDSIDKLWERLVKEEIVTHHQVNLYTSPIHDHFNGLDPEPLFTAPKLTRHLEKNFPQVPTPQQFFLHKMKPLFEQENGVPLKRSYFCMQNTKNNYVFDAFGDIYGCYEEAGNQKLKIGRFDENGVATLNKRYDTYQDRHVGTIEKCSKCSLALTCGGGCPMVAKGNSTAPESVFQNACDAHKEQTAKAVQHIFKDIVDKKFNSNPLETHWRDDKPFA